MNDHNKEFRQRFGNDPGQTTLCHFGFDGLVSSLIVVQRRVRKLREPRSTMYETEEL